MRRSVSASQAAITSIIIFCLSAVSLKRRGRDRRRGSTPGAYCSHYGGSSSLGSPQTRSLVHKTPAKTCPSFPSLILKESPHLDNCCLLIVRCRKTGPSDVFLGPPPLEKQAFTDRHLVENVSRSPYVSFPISWSLGVGIGSNLFFIFFNALI